MVNPIESVEDLAKQQKIPYGCLASGSTQSFFKNSNFTTYARMWSFMESARPSVFVESNDKGVERVKKGEYAFLMESTSIEYIVERECDLYQVGGLLDSKVSVFFCFRNLGSYCFCETRFTKNDQLIAFSFILLLT